MPPSPIPASPAARPPRPWPLLAAAALATVLAAAPARATPARALALQAGDYLEDDTAAFRWPGAARDHAGRLWLDSGRVDPQDGWNANDELRRAGPAAGLVWNPGQGGGPWTAGFAAYARAADGDHVGLHRDGPGADFSWLVGRAVGPVDLAATWRSAYGGLSSDGDARDEFEHNRDDLGLGARLDLSARAYLDLAGDLRRQRNRVQAPGDPAPWDTGELASTRSWSARARAFIALGEATVLTPVAEVLREDFSGPVIGAAWYPDAVWAHDNRLWRLGAALAWLPDPDRLVALTFESLDLRGRRTLLVGEPAGDPWSDVRTYGLRLAAEQRVNWWLSLRASVGATTVAAPGAVDGQYLDLAGGLALHLGAWGADLTAGGAPLPEPWRWLLADPGAEAWLHATLHRDF